MEGNQEFVLAVLGIVAIATTIISNALIGHWSAKRIVEAVLGSPEARANTEKALLEAVPPDALAEANSIIKKLLATLDAVAPVVHQVLEVADDITDGTIGTPAKS